MTSFAEDIGYRKIEEAMRTMIVGCAVAGTLLMGSIGIMAQATTQARIQSTNAPSVTATNSAGSVMATDQLLSSTVHEAWLASGRNEDKFFDMVKELAAMSAQKRGVTLPDTEAAGRAMGMAIKASARRDPDQLLYAVVDAAVKATATGQVHSPAAAK